MFIEIGYTYIYRSNGKRTNEEWINTKKPQFETDKLQVINTHRRKTLWNKEDIINEVDVSSTEFLLRSNFSIVSRVDYC